MSEIMTNEEYIEFWNKHDERIGEINDKQINIDENVLTQYKNQGSKIDYCVIDNNLEILDNTELNDKIKYNRAFNILQADVYGDAAELKTNPEYTIIGVYVYFKFKHNKLGMVCWIRYVVIHKDYRNKGYSKKLIKNLSKKCDVIGLTTINPYIIRAVKSVSNSDFNKYLNQEYLKDVIKLTDIEFLQNKLIEFYDKYAIIDVKNHIKKMDCVKDILPFGSQFIGIFKIKNKID